MQQNPKAHKAVSFNGKGKITVEYYRNTEENLAKIYRKMQKTLNLPNLDNLSAEEILALLTKAKMFNKKGNQRFLAVKKVIISDGRKHIPDHYFADEIVQNGGKIKGKLSADVVEVSAGENNGVVAKTYTQNNNPTIQGNITTKDFIGNNTTINKNLDFSADTITLNNSTVEPYASIMPDGDVHLNNTVQGGHIISRKGIVSAENSQFPKSSYTQGKQVNLANCDWGDGMFSTLFLNISPQGNSSTSFWQKFSKRFSD